MRRTVSRSFVTFVCLLTVVGGTAVASGEASDAVGTTAHRAPLSPTSGRFHALAAPAHLAAYPLLGAAAHKTVVAAGRVGIPAGGVEALAVTLTVTSASGPTQIWAGPGPTAPDVPALSTEGIARSSFGIVPVSDTGAIDLWNGPASAGLRVDVTGWFSSDAVDPANTAGLFTRLASYQVGSARVAAGGTKTIAVGGVQDVPTAVMAAMLRIHTSKTKAAGTLGLGSTATAAGGGTSLAYRRGAFTDLGISALSSSGKVSVQNRGTKPVTVRLDAVGVFASGADTHVFGDALSIVDPVSVADGVAVDATGVTLTTAGAAGIPGGDARTPPSLVLLRTLATGPTATGGLTIDAADTSATGAIALGLRANAPSSGLLLAPPASSGGSTVASTAGSTTVSAEAYAYFAGGIVMAQGLHVLSDETASAITDLQPTSITFGGVPTELTDLAVGDPFSAGVTPTTPSGFIRIVTGVSSPGGDLTLQTEDAALDQLYQQGDVSVGASVSKAPTVPATPRLGQRIPGGSCSINAFFIGAEVGCTAGEANPLYAASVGMGMRAELQLVLHVSWLFPSESKMFIQLSGGISVAADFRSVTTTDLTFEFPLEDGDTPSAPFPAGCSFLIPAGPIEIPMPCYPGVDAEISGHITPDTDGHIEAGASFVASFDSDTGASFESSATHSGDGHAFGTDTDVQLQIGVGPELEWRPWNNPIAKVFVGIQRFARFTMDHCTAKGSTGLQLQGGFAVTVFDHNQVVNEAFSQDLPGVVVFSHPVHNCAIWSGTIRSQYQLHLGDTSAISHEKIDHVADSTVTIQPPKDGFPPVDDTYDLKGTGSGVAKDVIIDGINCGGVIVASPRKDIYVFSGDLFNVTTAAFDTQILPNDDTHRHYTATILAIPYLGMHGDHQADYWYPTDDGQGCVHYDPDPEPADYAGGWLFSLLPVAHSAGAGGQLQFTVDASGHAKGVRTLTDNEGGSWTMTFDLQKTCTKGGSNC